MCIRSEACQIRKLVSRCARGAGMERKWPTTLDRRLSLPASILMSGQPTKRALRAPAVSTAIIGLKYGLGAIHFVTELSSVSA